MKKLILIAMLFSLRACVPAPAETIYETISSEWVTSVAISEDGQHRVKIKYAIDVTGRVAIYEGVYVWYGNSWMYASSGSDSEGTYVYYMGSKYYF